MANLVDMSNYYAVQSAYFVRVDVPTVAVYGFSNYDYPYTIAGELYTDLGALLNVTNSQSELRVSEQEVTVAISGIEFGTVTEVLSNPWKGSEIIIRRAFFDINSGALIPVSGNPAIKFQGIIGNSIITEELNQPELKGTFTITFVCVGIATLLQNKISGRRTNPLDEAKYFPADNGFSRVPTLKNANYQFGAPREVTTAGVK